MFARRIKSALFIDYENVGGLCPPDAIANWIAWLEDGQFDKNQRKRKFLAKRVYWNPSALRHETTFQQHGFVTVLCEKFRRLKNGADIRIALDIAEIVETGTRIEEFILFTKDTDFVPVLQRLRLRRKKTAVLVDENQEEVYATYSHHSDVVIPVRIFQGAPDYERVVRRSKIAEAIRVWRDDRRSAKAAARVEDVMSLAEHHVIRVTSLRPNVFTARRDIENELSNIEGFSTRGEHSYLGRGSYRALMEELGKRNDRIKISSAPYGGISVRYVPKEEE